MWRILCLHGYGTSAKILKSQISDLARALGEHFEFVFIDGTVDCDVAPGLKGLVSPPFHCYYQQLSESEVKRAHGLIARVIKNNGPFEGVLGFSQGASLALSYLMQHEFVKSGAPSPFRFAVLFAPFFAVSPDENLYSDIVQGMSAADMEIFKKFYKKEADQPSATEINITPKLRLMELGASALRMGVEFGITGKTRTNQFVNSCEVAQLPRIFDGRLLNKRLHIPVVHVLGRNDSLKEQSELTKNLCFPDHMMSLYHNGGHVIPRKDQDLKAICDAIDWAIGHGNTIAW